MRKIALIAAIIAFSLQAYTQDFNSRPKVYMGFSTGINNMVGIIGPHIDLALTDQLMLEGGFGLGSWGYKSTVNMQYHKDAHRGLFCKVGYSNSTGLPNFETKLELDNGDEEN